MTYDAIIPQETNGELGNLVPTLGGGDGTEGTALLDQ